ncbi:MAG: SLC13 family permease [Trichloromonas sp.]|jgi:di/tricarboxylate transporter|nr:SLC13 family permease [Trichloromonas sp.]
MTGDQITIFAILGLTLALFIWNRWRYDIVSLLALLAVAGFGLVPGERIFAGFGHPAVVTVMAVLVLSRGLFLAGAVDSMARALARVGRRPSIQAAVLTGIVALSSGVMNNAGALALLMPVAVWMSRQSGRSPSLLLMPLAFGSLLGGTLTMIGTPPNIIIASYREHTGAPPFGMFDFLPVGSATALAGLVFIALAGWRLTPKRIREGSKKLFRISDYLTEVRVPESSRLVGQPLHNLLSIAGIFGGALLLVLTRVLSAREAYAAIELPVIVLLAALIPLGEALETSGGARLIAEELLTFARGASPTAALALLTAATMLLSNVVNNTAAAILTAPIALGLAERLGISADPLLMGVAIGASCAFLTPIGHQSNTLVMEPGGYRFGDYWRMGLPLSLLLLAVAVPLIPASGPSSRHSQLPTPN